MHNPARKPDSRETGIMQRMRASVRALELECPHVLVACSGGKDSVALVWLLAEMKRLGEVRLTLAHIHHGLHHRADDAANAVTEIGASLGVSTHIRRLDADEVQSHAGVGLEEALRRERYRALAIFAREVGADVIAVGHHQSDQAETILLHLIRGAGLDGLSGMRVVERRPVPWWEEDDDAIDVTIWRPLLEEPQEEIEKLAAASSLPIVEDPTNADSQYRRNSIRLSVLPLLEEIAAGSTASIARSASLVATDSALLHHLTAESLASVAEDGDLDRAKLLQLEDAMQLRVIRCWILQNHPILVLSSERIRAVQSLLTRNRGGSEVQLGSGIVVLLNHGKLSIGSCQNRGR